jgi:hypothetical protein
MADGTQIITTPVQAPNANAFAERWVRTVRQECLDWMLIWGAAISSGSWRSTCGTTTMSDHIEALRFVRRAVTAPDPHRHRPLSRSPTAFGVGIVSGAWSTSTTRPRHDVQVSEPYGAARWRRSSPTRAATQRFAEAVAHGDFDMAETEAQRLLDRR